MNEPCIRSRRDNEADQLLATHSFAPPANERVRLSKAAETARQRLGLRQSKTSRKLVRRLLPVRWPHAAPSWGSGSPHVGGYGSWSRCVCNTNGEFALDNPAVIGKANRSIQPGLKKEFRAPAKS